MRPLPFYSQKALIAKGRSIQQGMEVVSFDLFDTLLVRRTHDPDLVKLPVAQFISQMAREQGHDWDWKQVQLKRNEIEQAMRDQTGETFEDHEACYPVFMMDTLRAIFADAADQALLEKVTAYELAMENAMLVARAEILEWVKELAAAGKRILVISDIYLPAKHLEVLLDHAGILQHVEAVISSADSFLAKASGRAYPYIAAHYDLLPKTWMHIGDNPISDGFRPGELGITALLLQDPEEHRRKAIAARHFFYSLKRPFWKGRLLQQLMAPLEGENSPRSVMYTEGYNFLGPLICMFVHLVAQRCRENNITKVFFLSREGWMFKQVWEKTMPMLYPDGKLPQIDYLYVSRQALAGASCAHEGLTQEKADIVFLPAGNRCFRDVCRVFSLDPEGILPHLQRFEIDLESVLSPAHDGFTVENRQAFEYLLRDQGFQDEVKRQSADANLALQRYLESLDFFEHQDVALVDIGWLGTIQRFFHGAIAHRDDRPTLHGMLLYARDLFEEACRAPFPTLNAYALKDDGGYELVFRQMGDDIGKGEQSQDAHYADLQQAVLDAADRFAAASVMAAGGTRGYRPWINYLLVSKLAFARLREINAIRHLHHLDDFHGANKPRRARRPRLIHNPWEVSGWKQWLGCLTQRQQFRKLLKALVNN